jgi:hypothetical protein
LLQELAARDPNATSAQDRSGLGFNKVEVEAKKIASMIGAR